MSHHFYKGQELLVAGHRFEIVDRISTGLIRLRNIVTDELIARPMSYLVNELFSGNIEMVVKGTGTFTKKGISEKLLTRDFLEFPEHKRAEARRRLEYITEYIKQRETRKTKKALNPIITVVKKRINDQKAPSWLTFYRWLRNYIASGGDVRSQLPLDCGSKNNRLDEVVETFIDDAYKVKYLTLERLTVGDVHDAVILKVDSANKFRDEGDKYATPHLSTVYRRKEELDPYDVKKSRYGKKAADEQFKQNKSKIEYKRPLERAEIDSTKSDLFVVDMERRLPIGRPWLVSAIDVKTSCILGIYWSFVPPSYCSLMQCLLHSIKPKNYVKDLYDDIINTWDTFGIMENCVVDNGKEYWSDDFVDAAFDLGTLIQYTPKGLPWYKGKIERWFKTTNRRLLHNQPGTSFSNIFDRADYDPKKNAIIDFETFNHILHKWIIDDYHQHPHRGAKDIPAHLWKIGTQIYPPNLPSSKNKLNVLLGSVYERTITANGIELHGLMYKGDNLGLIRKGNTGKVTKVKADLTDLGMIYVLDDFKGEYIPVSVSDEYTDYANGLTLWQHQIIRKHAIQHLKGRTDVIALAMARKRISEIVTESWNKRTKSSTSVKMGRWHGYDQKRSIGSVKNAKIVENANSTENTQQKELIHVEGAGKALQGISDTQAFTIETMPEVKGDIIQSEAINGEGETRQSQPKLLPKKKRNTRPKSITTKPNTEAQATTKGQEEDGIVDMTGWRGSYEMPMHKGDQIEEQ